MDGDEFGAVGEGGLDLDLVDHLGDAFHDLVAREECGAEAHEIGDGTAVAGAFHDLVGDDGDGLGIVELEAAGLAPAGKIGGDDDQEFFALARGQMHGGRRESGNQEIRKRRRQKITKGTKTD